MMHDSEKVIGHLNDCMEASRRDNTWVFVRKDIVEDALALLKDWETMMQCIKGKCRICPHCENCDVDENGQLKDQEKTRLEIAHEIVSGSILMYQGKKLICCKDCKYGYVYYDGDEPNGVVCDGVWHNDDWFCAGGVKRE